MNDDKIIMGIDFGSKPSLTVIDGEVIEFNPDIEKAMTAAKTISKVIVEFYELLTKVAGYIDDVFEKLSLDIIKSIPELEGTLQDKDTIDFVKTLKHNLFVYTDILLRTKYRTKRYIQYIDEVKEFIKITDPTVESKFKSFLEALEDELREGARDE